MSDERPLVHDDSLGELGRALLRSGRDAAPPQASKDKLLMALGVGVAAKTSATGAAAAASKSVLLAKKLTALKGVALAAGGLVAATAAYVSAVAPNEPAPPLQHFGKPEAAAAIAERERAVQAPLPAFSVPRVVTAPPTEAAPEAPRLKAQPGFAQSRAALRDPHAGEAPQLEPAQPDVSLLPEEVKLLDQVRAAIQRHHWLEAEAGLEIYQARFPAGVLRPEAAKLAARLQMAKP